MADKELTRYHALCASFKAHNKAKRVLKALAKIEAKKKQNESSNLTGKT